MVNHAPIPIPACNSGPDRSCPAPQFIEFMQQRKELYGDFTTACELEDQKNATDVFSIFTGNVLP
jgi:acid phosphatase